MASLAAGLAETQKRRSSDPISWYLATIGRIPLLTPAEEIELGNQVQAMMRLTEDGTVPADESGDADAEDEAPAADAEAGADDEVTATEGGE